MAATKLRASALALAAAFSVSGCAQLGVDNPFSSMRIGDTPDYATASIAGDRAAPQVESGVAAWDGDLSSPGHTAAHAAMAPNSWARVTNANTGQTTVVRVTRSLASGKGRSMELSRDAAADVGALHDGPIAVLIEPIDPRQATDAQRFSAAPTPPRVSPPAEVSAVRPAPRAVEGWDPNIGTASIPRRPNAIAQSAPPLRTTPPIAARYVQVGAFRDMANAQRMLTRLRGEGMAGGAYGDAFIETTHVQGSAFHRVRVGPLETDMTAQRALRDAKALGHTGAAIVRP